MTLRPEETTRYYGIFMPLLTFVNQQKKLLPGLEVWDLDHPLEPEKAKVLRDALWADSQLLEAFISRNPAHLGPQDLAVARSWRRFLNQAYFVVKHLKKHSIFSAKGKHYAVVGLASPISELLPVTPFYVSTVLLPFEGKIIYDSIFGGFNMSFGAGIRRTCNQEYQQARRAGTIIYSLEVDDDEAHTSAESSHSSVRRTKRASTAAKS